MPVQTTVRQEDRDYNNPSTAAVSKFMSEFRARSSRDGAVFDSAGADDFVSEGLSRSGSTIPPDLSYLLDKVGDDKQNARVMQAIFDSAAEYERRHGVSVPADVIETAIHNARAVYDDTATSDTHATTSLQPNRAIVAIITTLSDGIPFAHYMPADIKSNQAKLAIVTHKAGTTTGAYTEGNSLDGANAGRPYLSSQRTHTCTVTSADGVTKATGRITAIQTDVMDVCDQTAPPIHLLRGRSQVYIAGILAAKESTDSTNAGGVSGSIEIFGTSHVVTGQVNPDTGAIDLTITPSLPENIPVVVDGYIDYEHGDQAIKLTPRIITDVTTYDLLANPWRGQTRISIDSGTQMANELGLDGLSQGLMSLQNQVNIERHYTALRAGYRIAHNNIKTYQFQWDARKDQLKRSDIWEDFSYPLGEASQQMTLDTLGFGITHLYVTKRVAAQFQGLSNDVFTPSGIPERAGIYRVGRLFGRYEVYYTPQILKETESSAQVLCVGRSFDPARSPVVLGDAVPATMVPLAVGDDMKRGTGYYARNFTQVNPHRPSSRGFALIEISGMQ